MNFPISIYYNDFFSYNPMCVLMLAVVMIESVPYARTGRTRVPGIPGRADLCADENADPHAN